MKDERTTFQKRKDEVEYRIIMLLKAYAKRQHPHSNDICRWGGGAVAKYKICNICEDVIGHFDGRYPRTNKSIREEEEHIQGHVDHLIEFLDDGC